MSKKRPVAPAPALSGSRIALALFYSCALLLYFVLFGDRFLAQMHLPEVLAAPIMALGSFVAGATFLGGGSVAFPALTKILAVEPEAAKIFSLAIQSVGMTSASIYILVRVKKLPLRFMLLYLAGAFVGVVLSLWSLQGQLTATDLRVGFTLFILGFLLIYLWTISTRDNDQYTITHLSLKNSLIVLVSGLLGGAISGQLGSGADLVAFSLMVLFFHVNLKLATQVSVIIMASTSLVGIGCQAVAFSGIPREVSHLWYVAAPVVLIGAPVGAIFCRRIRARYLVVFICTIVAVEVLSTLLLVQVEAERIKYYVLASLAGGVLLFLLKHYSAVSKAEVANTDAAQVAASRPAARDSGAD